jgi:hypothetical protein
MSLGPFVCGANYRGFGFPPIYGSTLERQLERCHFSLYEPFNVLLCVFVARASPASVLTGFVVLKSLV